MRLRDFLNEFELDWALSASRIKGYSYDKLSNKKIAVAGFGDDYFTRAVIYSVLGINDSKNANISIKLVCLGRFDDSLYSNILNDRKDFEVIEAGETVNADYLICTGGCNRHGINVIDTFRDYINSYNLLFKNIDIFELKRVIFLSDYRVYSPMNRGFIYSEYEMGKIQLFTDKSLEQSLLQSLEAIVVSYAKQFGFKYIILRSALLYGACFEENDNIIYSICKSIANEEKREIINSSNSFSSIYINDLLQAIYFSMIECPSNKVYNVTGPDTSINTMELVTLAHKIFPAKSKIYIEQNISDVNIGIAMNSDKLEYYGWEPCISLEDGITMVTKSMLNDGRIFIFDESYQGKLDTIHEILLAYLLEIDRICKKHDIKYFLAGGTLLGAVRHNGFIPWDDDADVMMLREDYEKFKNIVSEELPDNLFFQVPKTEKLNHHVFSKIRINNTMFATAFTSKFLDMHNGIFVDILSHDKTGNTRFSQNLHRYATLATRSMVFNKWGNTPIKTGGKHPVMCVFANIAKDVFPMKFLEWFQDKTIGFYKNSKKSEYLYDGMGRNLRRGAFPKRWLDDVLYIDFEGYKLPIPKEYDNYLTYLYGDYMQMIPVSERRTSHSIVLMDLGEYTEFMLKK